MKKVLMVFPITACIVTTLLYVTFGKGPQNYRSFNKVELGMSKSNVLELMGPPEHIINNEENRTYVYLYQPPVIYVSEQIEIVFNESSDKVVKLSNPQ
ncbi:hypothetical protein H9Q13_11960 [Pontibacter sp. JH31]|uniref:Lipoprotein SmpA/OmlA domain-containing protein n=1 Tax=Pontibacter aquaedesilientis TaxID=2766980 RepID=A0ABR7XHV3_9BACT|nr:hypothetical protein [Pontibacter aquaedesilientis]MBD1397882.1 hypothetical protein [Pontibacter aquaedesilientis]